MIILFVLFVFYERYDNVDLSKFQSSTKTIEVKGEVEHPGVYEVDLHANVKTIIEQAGGYLVSADTSSVNETMDVANKGVIVVPKQTETKKISLNSATLEELDTLKGIGPAVAKRIIEYRSAEPFRSIEEIKNVKGIGDKLFEKIKDSIAL